MDINSIIQIVKEIPKDKWNDDKTIKKAIQKARRTSGKNFSEAELNKYVQQFRSYAKGGSSLSLLSIFLKNGIEKNQIGEIRRKMRN